MWKVLLFLQKHKKKLKPESFNFSAIHLIHDPQGIVIVIGAAHTASIAAAP